MVTVDEASYDGDIVPTRRRLERNMYLVLTAMVLGSLMIGNRREILGTVVGGLLGLLNHRWLSTSLGAILSTAAQTGQPPTWAAWKFILRYLVIGFGIGLALWSGWFDLTAMVVGFCAFIGALMIEAGYQIYLIIRCREESTR
ncbi:MAG: ATP synthase subunit I [bacterium]